jgi:hypothetical protein
MGSEPAAQHAGNQAGRIPERSQARSPDRTVWRLFLQHAMRLTPLLESDHLAKRIAQAHRHGADPHAVRRRAALGSPDHVDGGDFFHPWRLLTPASWRRTCSSTRRRRPPRCRCPTTSGSWPSRIPSASRVSRLLSKGSCSQLRHFFTKRSNAAAQLEAFRPRAWECRPVKTGASAAQVAHDVGLEPSTQDLSRSFPKVRARRHGRTARADFQDHQGCFARR